MRCTTVDAHDGLVMRLVCSEFKWMSCDDMMVHYNCTESMPATITSTLHVYHPTNGAYAAERHLLRLKGLVVLTKIWSSDQDLNVSFIGNPFKCCLTSQNSACRGMHMSYYYIITKLIHSSSLVDFMKSVVQTLPLKDHTCKIYLKPTLHKRDIYMSHLHTIILHLHYSGVG